ncbi:MAG: 30S ribosomal protein S18 [Acidimicrobiales bacterium]|nr:30S ribosomal protein S18 [Acidimicrobiales bacterium]
MAKKREVRGKNKDNARRSKKKISLLSQEKVVYVDYKDVNLLRRFMSDRAKIRARRVTGNDAQQQREVARAIKNAREMALLPYTNRVTTQRGGGRGDRERDRGLPRPDGPPPRPTGDTPPPPVGGSSDVEADLELDVELDGGGVAVAEATEAPAEAIEEGDE